MDNDILSDVIDKLLYASIGTSSSIIVGSIVFRNRVAVIPCVVGLGAFLFSFIPYDALEAQLDSIMQKSDYLENGIVAYTMTTYLSIPYSQVIIDRLWDGKLLIGEIGYIGELDVVKPLW